MYIIRSYMCSEFTLQLKLTLFIFQPSKFMYIAELSWDFTIRLFFIKLASAHWHTKHCYLGHNQLIYYNISRRIYLSDYHSPQYNFIEIGAAV